MYQFVLGTGDTRLRVLKGLSDWSGKAVQTRGGNQLVEKVWT